MIFEVELGTGSPTATSLVSLERANTHLAATGWASDWDELEENRKEELLMTATSIISNSFSFRGTLLNELQALPFPRKDLRDRENRLISGIPYIVQAAVAELALAIANTNYMEDSELGALESIRVGPISLEVSESAATTKVIPDSIIRLLSEFGTYRFGKARMRRLIAG